MKRKRNTISLFLSLTVVVVILIGNTIFYQKINNRITRTTSILDILVPTNEKKAPIPTISSHDNHDIPNILIFTYSRNILEIPVESLNASELLHLRNIQKTIALHPNAEIRFLDDEACVKSLSNVLGLDSVLLESFRKEGFGPFKADMCRGAALYETGGLYFDLDIHAIQSIWSIIPRDTQFVVPKSSGGGQFEGFFQAFVGSVKLHPIWISYLKSFEEIYKDEKHVGFPGAPGVVLLWKSYLNLPDSFKERSVLWQEERYDKAKFPDILPPVGYGNCQYIVYEPGSNIVIFYSRIFGSRACNRIG